MRLPTKYSIYLSNTIQVEAGEGLKRNAVLITVLVLATLLLVPLASAVPLKEKTNDKFQTYHVDLVVDASTWVIFGDFQAHPSMEKSNYVTISGPETFMQYDLTIGSHVYHQVTDFIYTGHFEYVYYDVEAWAYYGPYVWPADNSYRTNHLLVDYSLTFLLQSGIDGTINLRAVSVEGNYGMSITSLSGTGDLQNVQVKATSSNVIVDGTIYSGTHNGWVTGWPN